MSSLPPIVLVDNDADDLFILRRLLAKGGIENKIIAFEDPRAAKDYLELESHNTDPKFLPCAVLTDLNMPVMSGAELTAWIRGNPKLSKLAVIILSNSERPEDEALAKASGATRFLRKYPTSLGLRNAIGVLPCTTET